MIGRNYVGQDEISKLASLPKATSKNYTYSLDKQGITATAKDGEYELKIPSYTDGRICCSGAGCDKLNKDYPQCGSFTPDEATCEAEIPEPEPEPEPETTCTLTDYTRTCQEEGYSAEYTGSVTYTVNADCTGHTKTDTCKKVPSETTEGCEWEEGVIVPFGEERVDCETSWSSCGRGNKYKCTKDAEGDPWWEDLGMENGVCPLTKEEKETCKCDQSYLDNFKSCDTNADGTKSCKAPCRYGYDGEETCKYFCNKETGKWNNQGACEQNCTSTLRWVPSLTEIGCSPECNGWCTNQGGSSMDLSDSETASKFYEVFAQVPFHKQWMEYSTDSVEQLGGACDRPGQSVRLERCTRPIWDGSSFHPNTIGEQWSYYKAPRKQIITLTCLAREDDHRDKAGGGWGDKLVSDYLLLLECPSGCETVAECPDASANCGCSWYSPGHTYDSHCWKTVFDGGSGYEGDVDWWTWISGWGGCNGDCPPPDPDTDPEITGGEPPSSIGYVNKDDVTCTSGSHYQYQIGNVCYCGATVTCSDGKSMDYGPLPCTCSPGQEPPNNGQSTDNGASMGCHTEVIMDGTFDDGRTGWCFNRTICNGVVTATSDRYLCQTQNQPGINQ